MITFTSLSAQDFGVLQKAEVPLEGRGLVLVKGDNKDTTSASSNGSGKTTLFKALSWCLFGEVVGDGRITSEAIRHGAKKAIVNVEFTDGIHEYRVERSRTPSGGSLTLYTDGYSTTGRTSRDTEARIVELLGLDWQAFRNTVLYGQGDIKRFADKHTSDAERKSILKQILRLDVFDRAKEEAARRIRQVGEEIDAIKAEQVACQAALNQKVEDFAENEERRDAWNSKQAQRVVDLRRSARDKQSEAEDLRNGFKHAETTKERLEQIEASLDGRDEVEAARRAADDEVRRLTKENMAAHRALNEHVRRHRTCQEAESRALVDALAAQRKAKSHEEAEACLTCGQPLPEEKRAALEAEAKEAHQAAMDRLIEAREALEEAQAVTDSQQEAFDESEKALEEAEAKKAEASERWSEVARLEAERRTVAEEVDKLKSAEADAQRMEAEALSLSEQADELEKMKCPFDELLDADDEKCRQLDRKLTGIKERVEAKLREREPLKWWRDAFSDTGVPSLAMDNIMPVLTASANSYLDILSDGDITVDISTEKALKGGGTKDNISITQTIEGLPDVTPSGGQRSKISLAVDLGLMDVVASREGAEINLMMLDEVLDGLDGEGKARVVELLKHLRTIRPSLFVVSHDDSIQEHFETVITVTKAGGKAALETR